MEIKETNRSQFPNFFVVGAAKSGTTALWKYFQKHPDIFVTTEIAYKELGYFSKNYGISDKDKYLTFFSAAKNNQIIGEVCHSYLSSPESAKLIFNDCPNAKIVMLLRNPIDRAYSLYNWMVMHGYEGVETFEKAIKLEKVRIKDPDFINNNVQGFYQNYLYINSGMYYQQVKRYYDIFGQNNVKVIIYDDYKSRPASVYNDLCEFLEVESIEYDTRERVNVSKRVRSAKLHLRLSQKTRSKPNSRLNKLYLKLIKYNVKNEIPQSMLPATQTYLQQVYKEDIENLSRLLEVNLTEKWLKT